MAFDFQVLREPAVSARFWSKVQKDEGCWVWLGSRDGDEYGLFSVTVARGSYKTVRAHRASYFLSRGEMPAEVGRHSCDHPWCVNDAHVLNGTHQDNVDDKMRRGRHVSGTKGRPDLVARGEDHGNALLSDEAVRDIRENYVPRKTPLRLFAEKHGVAISTVHCALNSGWSHVEARRGL